MGTATEWFESRLGRVGINGFDISQVFTVQLNANEDPDDVSPASALHGLPPIGSTNIRFPGSRVKFYDVLAHLSTRAFRVAVIYVADFITIQADDLWRVDAVSGAVQSERRFATDKRADPFGPREVGSHEYKKLKEGVTGTYFTKTGTGGSPEYLERTGRFRVSGMDVLKPQGSIVLSRRFDRAPRKGRGMRVLGFVNNSLFYGASVETIMLIRYTETPTSTAISTEAGTEPVIHYDVSLEFMWEPKNHQYSTFESFVDPDLGTESIVFLNEGGRAIEQTFPRYQTIDFNALLQYI